MKSLFPIFSLLAAGLLVLPAGSAAEDTATPPRVGGPFEVESARDIAYYEGKDADAERHKLDVYRPSGQKDAPVLFYIHGGGWRAGSKKGTQRLGEMFARNGVVFVTTNYRLSPGVKHPVHVQDVARAFAWTQKNIAKYGGRPGAIFVSGHSAGGHLAALLATDETYAKAEGLSLRNIRGAIPISGVYRIPAGKSGGPLSQAFGDDDEARKQASPLEHIDGSKPPFLILYASKDIANCAKQSAELAEALKKNKVEASSLEIKDRDHGSLVGKMANEEDPAAQAILAFLARHGELQLHPKK
jgi:arylformamidase